MNALLMQHKQKQNYVMISHYCRGKRDIWGKVLNFG